MKSHSEFSDIEFEQAFANCEFDPALFSHEAHLRLAWIHVQRYGVETAISNITTQLRNYVAFLGATDKYNETVTVAAIRAVQHFVLKSNPPTFIEFIERHSRLKTHFKDLLRQHYTVDIFNSPEAKETFVEPDLLPFDPYH